VCKKGYLLGVLLAILISIPLISRAGEIKFPVYSYEGEELKKVREWEKVWVGKRITTENVDEVKDFLHEAVYKAMKNPEIFGAESLWFEIVPYRPYNLSPGMIAATKKYAPTSKLDENESLIGYGDIAGIPFPHPKTGIEMAWNFDGNTKGDTHHEYGIGSVVDCRSRLEREAGHLRWEVHWMGRYDVPPLPKIPDEKNKRGIHRSFFMRMTAPVDFVDTAMLEIKYKDTHRENDMWVYTAMFRRIR